MVDPDCKVFPYTCAICDAPVLIIASETAVRNRINNISLSPTGEPVVYDGPPVRLIPDPRGAGYMTTTVSMVCARGHQTGIKIGFDPDAGQVVVKLGPVEMPPVTPPPIPPPPPGFVLDAPPTNAQRAKHHNRIINLE